MNNDNKIRLYRVSDDDGYSYYVFFLSTDEYFLWNSALLAVKDHGTVLSTINGKEFSEYHRAQYYRTYMIWGTLPLEADTTKFLNEVLNRRNQTLIANDGQIVGIVSKEL